MMRKILSMRRLNPKRIFYTFQILTYKKPNFNTKFALASTFFLFSTYSTIKAQDFYQKTIPANLIDGQMIQVQVGPKQDDAVLVAKIDGLYYCVQNKCSHFGAPLGSSVLFGDKVMCPWHNAAFSVKTGQAQMGPVFNGLQSYQIKEQNGNLYIKVPVDKLNTGKVMKMAKKNDKNRHKIVIVGGGLAGLSAAQTLRQSGYDGSITMVCKQKIFPYDRTMVSKNLKAKGQDLVIRNPNFFNQYDIQVKLGTQVTSINYDSKNIIANGEKITYDKLLLASGCTPRVPPVQGINQIKPLTIRNVEDINTVQRQIRQQNKKSITIIGASFIGLQLASAIKSVHKDNVDVTVCEYFQVPFQHVLGEKVGGFLKNMHVNNGVKFLTGTKLVNVSGNNQKVQLNYQVDSVTLQNCQTGQKQQLKSDLTVFATGVQPATKFAKGVGMDNVLFFLQMGGIITDAFLRTTKNDVFAAGDIANYPFWYLGQRVRVQHYNQAIYQGSVAALNMISKYIPVDNIPFFWTRHYTSSLQYTGHAKNWDNVIVHGNMNESKFIAFYVQKNKIVAAAAMGMSPALMIINQAMRLGIMSSAQQIQKGFKLQQLRQRVQKYSPGCKKCKLTTH